MSLPPLSSQGQRCVLVAWLCACSIATTALHAQPLPSGYQLSPETESRCLSVLRDAIHAEDFRTAIHAAEALTRAGRGQDVMGPFTQRLANETDDRKKCVWSRELVRAGDASKLSVMLEILAKPDPYAHVNAAESLYKVGGLGDGNALRAAMGKRQDPILEIMAAGALGKHGDRGAMKLLRARLTDPDLKTARIAAWVLGRMGGPSDIPGLRLGVGRSPDDLTRCYFEHSLAALGDAEGLKALERNLTNGDKLVRAYAATFAGDARAVSLAPRLIPLLDDPATDVRVRACQTLFVFDRSARTKASAKR